MISTIISKLSFLKKKIVNNGESKKENSEEELEKQLAKAKTILEQSARPFFLYDDDPDGLSSFLILYKMIKSGKAMAIKGSLFSERMVEIIKNYQPDLIVILDKPVIEKEFFEKISTPCVWIDHHEPSEETRSLISKKEITYVNPRMYDKDNNQPTSLLTYKITKDNLWLAITGIVADWQLPPEEMRSKCEEECPGYLDRTIKTPEDALYKSNAGKIARVFSFNLKGKSSELLTAMKILSRIKNPDELLSRTHSQAKLIMKKYDQKLSEYNSLKASVKVDDSDPILIFIYDGNKNSFTTDLSNELLYEYPDKLILIARLSGDSYKCSLRSKFLRVDRILEASISQSGGRGGGHEHACGAVIPEDVFDEFVKALRKETSQRTIKK